jgi:hypothetical protein
MDLEPPHLFYLTGEEVHAGDRVRYRGVFATVVGVSDGENGEFSPGYTEWSGTERGIVVVDDDGEVSNLSETGENLEFVERS